MAVGMAWPAVKNSSILAVELTQNEIDRKWQLNNASKFNNARSDGITSTEGLLQKKLEDCEEGQPRQVFKIDKVNSSVIRNCLKRDF